MHFASPWMFLSLLLIPPAVFWGVRLRAKTGITFSSTRTASEIRPSMKRHLAFIPLALRIAAMISVAVALARPQVGVEFIKDVTEGIAMELVVDRSGSMAAEMNYDNVQLNRLEVVKKVINEFINGGKGGLNGRPTDLVGMVSFARYADTISPLTLSHGAIDGFLKTIKIVDREEEDGTAIGDAVALAAARLKVAGEDVNQSYQVKSKVIILLTDGRNNFGNRTPAEAAELAREWGIKVYTIGIGGGESYTTVTNLFGTFKVPLAGGGVNEQVLSTIAETTGGIYRSANDAEALRSVYREIDKLEKSKIEATRYVEYREVFTPFALAALALLAVSIMLSATVFRRIP